MTIKIAFASDHAGHELKEILKNHLVSGFSQNNYSIIDLGTDSADKSVDYPVFGKKAAESVVGGDADYAIIVCGSGIGISIAANRVAGARAALCHDAITAQLSRQHNDANILALGARIISEEVAKECLQAFVNTKFEGGRHQRRVDML